MTELQFLEVWMSSSTDYIFSRLLPLEQYIRINSSIMEEFRNLNILIDQYFLIALFSLLSYAFIMKLRFFQLAKRLTEFSDHHQHSIGSVIVKKNRVISVGHNSLKTHTHSPHGFKSTHSEFKACWGANPKDLKGASIYVYRQRRDGSLALARPCSSCYSFIKSCGIKYVYYTDYDSYKMEKVS